jgi:hypothetical protein
MVGLVNAVTVFNPSSSNFEKKLKAKFYHQEVRLISTHHPSNTTTAWKSKELQNTLATTMKGSTLTPFPRGDVLSLCSPTASLLTHLRLPVTQWPKQ